MTGRPSRRALLLGGAAAVTGAAAGAAAVLRPRATPPPPVGPGIPDAPEGRVRLEQVTSAARRRPVGLWTAVPAGHGDGRGLPVVLVLHGASATTADLSRFGLARFLSAAVASGVPPFVLAGADGGRTLWLGDGPGSADDPQALLAGELPRWCAERGFDATRTAAYGWSMGGAGALRGAQLRPGRWRAVAALSPAVQSGDAVLRDAALLDPARTGLWCGAQDGFLPAVRELAGRLTGPPAVASYAPGRHTRAYWDGVTPAAFAFLGAALGTDRS